MTTWKPDAEDRPVVGTGDGQASGTDLRRSLIVRLLREQAGMLVGRMEQPHE